MSAPAPVQRQIWPCDTCDHPRRGPLAVCTNGGCLAAAIDYLAAEDLNREAADDE